MSAAENTERQTIQERANEHYASRFNQEQRELIALAENYEVGESERYAEMLQEQPLSFQKIATYHVQEEIEWEILLGTGGPADRIIVRTDFNGTIESAYYQFQDWFEPWTTATNQDDELVRRYAEIVGYYEPTE